MTLQKLAFVRAARNNLPASELVFCRSETNEIVINSSDTYKFDQIIDGRAQFSEQSTFVPEIASVIGRGEDVTLVYYDSNDENWFRAWLIILLASLEKQLPVDDIQLSVGFTGCQLSSDDPNKLEEWIEVRLDNQKVKGWYKAMTHIAEILKERNDNDTLERGFAATLGIGPARLTVLGLRAAAVESSVSGRASDQSELQQRGHQQRGDQQLAEHQRLLLLSLVSIPEKVARIAQLSVTKLIIDCPLDSDYIEQLTRNLNFGHKVEQAYRRLSSS